nr:hypothetical protein [Tanacetum cinerariifolium]
MIITHGEGSANLTEPHHTPSPQEHHSPQYDSLPPSNQTIISEPIPQAPTETLTPRRYTRRAIRIAQSKALSPAADEPASLSKNDRQGETFLIVFSLDAGQDRENIAKTSAMPHESSSRVPSLIDNEGSMQQRIHELMELYTSLVSPADVLPVADVPTVSGSSPTVSVIFTTASVVAREMEEEFVRENQRLSEQLARDYEIARLHAEEELKIMIEGLDRSNEVIAKHLSEYEQDKADLSVGEKIKLIRELVKYQDHRAKILKYQAQQYKPLSKKEQREFYMSVWTLVKETFSTKQATRDKEKELWVELKRLFEPNFEDQLWTQHQAFMHDPLDWKLYDTCGVHHVSTKDQEIFMLVEKDYPLRKRLISVMISNKLQVEQYSQMASDLILKIYNITNSPR